LFVIIITIVITGY